MADGEEPLRKMGCLPALLTFLSLGGAAMLVLFVILKSMLY